MLELTVFSHQSPIPGTASACLAELLKNISIKTFYDTFHEQNSAENMAIYVEENFTDSKIKKELNDPSNIFILAEENGLPIGYAKLSRSSAIPHIMKEECIEICRIYVLKEAIGKGIGKAIMNKCIEIAHGLKHKMICLGVWEHNRLAIAFYERHGFEKFGEHVFMLGNDRQNDWLMKKYIGD